VFDTEDIGLMKLGAAHLAQSPPGAASGPDGHSKDNHH